MVTVIGIDETAHTMHPEKEEIKHSAEKSTTLKIAKFLLLLCMLKTLLYISFHPTKIYMRDVKTA